MRNGSKCPHLYTPTYTKIVNKVKSLKKKGYRIAVWERDTALAWKLGQKDLKSTLAYAKALWQELR